MDNEFERITPVPEESQPVLDTETPEQAPTDAAGPAARPAAQKRTVIRTRAPKVSSPKPLVEGVNAPIAEEPAAPKRVPLTSAEERLIKDPDSMPEIKPLRKEHLLIPEQPVRTGTRTIWGLVITLVIIAGGIAWFFWYEGMLPWSKITDNPSDSGMVAVRPPSDYLVPSSSEDSQTPPPQTATPTTTPAADPGTASSTPPAQSQKVKVTSTPTGYLNVRSQPSTSGQLVTQVSPGDILAYTETQNGWYHVVLPNGSTGWVTGQYVTAAE